MIVWSCSLEGGTALSIINRLIFKVSLAGGVTVFTIEPILIPPEYKERGLEDQPFNFSLERPAGQLAFRGEIEENN